MQKGKAPHFQAMDQKTQQIGPNGEGKETLRLFARKDSKCVPQMLFDINKG